MMGLQVIAADGRIEEPSISKVDYAVVERSGEVTVYIQGEAKKLKDPSDISKIRSYFQGRILYEDKHLLVIRSLSPKEIKDLLQERDSFLRKELSKPE